MALVGVLFPALALPFVWRTPGATDWLLMAIMGAFGALAHFLIIRAVEHAHATMF
jgi:hypothetical protein